MPCVFFGGLCDLIVNLLYSVNAYDLEIKLQTRHNPNNGVFRSYRMCMQSSTLQVTFAQNPSAVSKFACATPIGEEPNSPYCFGENRKLPVLAKPELLRLLIAPPWRRPTPTDSWKQLAMPVR